MKKFVLLFSILIIFTSCIDKLAIRQNESLGFENEHIHISPQKDVYKVGDTISVEIRFGMVLKHFLYEGTSNLEPEKRKSEFSAQMYKSEYFQDKIVFILNEKETFTQNEFDFEKISFLYDGNGFILKDNIKFVLNKAGEYDIKKMCLISFSINYYQGIGNNANNTIKVVP